MAWETEIYVASFLDSSINDYGQEIQIFDKPKLFMINHQPVSSFLSYNQYGSDINSVRRAYPDLDYVGGKIKPKDRVYLIDGENYGINLDELVSSDNEYCNKANYEVISCMPSKLRMQIDFKKIDKKR